MMKSDNSALDKREPLWLICQGTDCRVLAPVVSGASMVTVTSSPTQACAEVTAMLVGGKVSSARLSKAAVTRNITANNTFMTPERIKCLVRLFESVE